MNEDFLLETETARHLYHDYAKHLPLVDYHCHLNPREIYENKPFTDLAQVWLGGEKPDGTCYGDHYKWRLMRANGTPEEYVTGYKVDGFERFMAFVKALEKAIGNPIYHWCNLELRNFFGFEGYLNTRNAREVWDMCNEKLKNDPSLTPRGLIERSNVKYIGTTDDPIDTLEWHAKMAADPTLKVTVCPSYRPDKALNIHKGGFVEYMTALAKAVGKESFKDTDEVADALVERLEFFHKMGCGVSDHGLDYIPFREGTKEQADAALAKALKGEAVTLEEMEIYQTRLLKVLGVNYHRLGIVMQLHYSCLRNVNEKMFKRFGPDTGYDAIGVFTCVESIGKFLSALNSEDACPQTILYSLNPGDNAALATLTGVFQNEEMPGKIQLGSAWWFNDTKSGMEEQMKALANVGLLGNFVGMLTDSRSFLSYARHEYFRRILCNLVGNWVESGEYPNDDEALKAIVEGVSSLNAQRYFHL